MANTKQPKSLRVTAFTLIGVLFLAFVLFFCMLFTTSMTQRLRKTEEDYIGVQMGVTQGVIAATFENVNLMTKDVAFWEETAKFTAHENPDYIEKNWPESYGAILANYQYNYVVFKDLSGNDLYEAAYDYIAGQSLPLPSGLSQAVGPIARQVLNDSRTFEGSAALHPDVGNAQILFLGGTPYYLCTMPTMTYEASAQAAGTVTFGIVLDDTFFKSVTYLSSTEFAMVDEPYAGPAGSDFLQYTLDDGYLAVHIPMPDATYLVVTIERSAFASGRQAVYTTTLILIAALIGVAVLLYSILTRLICYPIEKLSADIASIDESGLLDASEYSGTEELSRLCRAINAMLERLDESNISINVFQSILNGMDAYIYVSDPETNTVLFMNDQMIDHFGFKRPVVGLLCHELLHPGEAEGRGRCSYCPNNVLDQDPTTHVIWEEQSPVSGRYYRNTASLIPWANDRPVHLQHRVDITDIRLAEATLKKRLQQQELMSTISRSFISTVDMQLLINRALALSGEFMDVSRILIASHDRKHRTLEIQYAWYNTRMGTKPPAHIAIDFLPGMSLFDQLVTEKAPYVRCDNILPYPEYETFAAEDTKSLLAIPLQVAGELWGVLYLDHCQQPYDWSDSDLQLATLIASVIAGVISRSISEDEFVRMSSIVETSPQFVAYIDDAAQFAYINKGAQERTGYTYDQLKKGGFALLFSDEHYRELIEDRLPLVYSDGRSTFDMPIIHSDGQARIFSFSVFLASQKTGGIGVIASDITEKTMLERELIEARDQAEESSRAKGDFLSRMSHEMRTPMNAIIGMTKIAMTSDEPSQKTYCLEKIDEASNHLLGVINDILDMSKIESGKFELAYGEVDFVKLLQRSADVINFRVEEKDQTFVIMVDERIPERLVTDEQRLTQVITNLLSNAVKFTPERGTITLSANLLQMAEDDDSCRVQIDVVDTGIGIAPDQQERLFQSFEQADGGIARRFGGTGLGLAISKSIVEMLGGHIWVTSDPGTGSTFSFTLEAKRGSKNSTDIAQNMQIDWAGIRILAVDDAPEILGFFKSLADTTGFVCDTALDASAALDALDAQGNYDLIFVDWRIPDTGGAELTRQIKARHSDTAVAVMISATELDGIEREAQAIGADRFLPKPLLSSAIVDIINDCLGLGRDLPVEPAKADKDQTDIFAGRTILLAEDIAINREILISLLEHTGLQFDCAVNGAEAIALFEANPTHYDMIFMDIHMPEVDGYEATRRIRKLDLPNAATIPIIAMTANVFREDVERCLAAGMDDHVGKPVDIDEIIAKMQKHLN